MISVIHPSRGRASIALSVVENWVANADNPKNIQYLLCVDVTDPELKSYRIADDILLIDDNKSAIQAINHGASVAAGDIIIVVSDDFDCPPHWDTLLLEAIGEKKDFCAKTNDGHQDWLITLPIMDRAYYERFGYVYNPIYGHMFADLEMTSLAWMLGRYIELPLTFKHNHYSVIGEKPDAINRKNNATWGHGQMMFKKRLSQNFGIDPVQGLPDLKKHFV